MSSATEPVEINVARRQSISSIHGCFACASSAWRTAVGLTRQPGSSGSSGSRASRPHLAHRCQPDRLPRGVSIRFIVSTRKYSQETARQDHEKRLSAAKRCSRRDVRRPSEHTRSARSLVSCSSLAATRYRSHVFIYFRTRPAPLAAPATVYWQNVAVSAIGVYQ